MPAGRPAGGRVKALQDEVKKLQQAVKKGQASDLGGGVDRLVAAAPEYGGTRLVVGELAGATMDAARVQVGRVRQACPSALVVFAWADDAGKVPVVVGLTPDLVAKGLNAGAIVKQVATVVGGSGGGKPDMAQAAGSDPGKLGDALATAAEVGRGLLGG